MHVENPGYMMSETSGPGERSSPPHSGSDESDVTATGAAGASSFTSRDRSALMTGLTSRDTYLWRGRSIRKSFVWQVTSVLLFLLFIIMLILYGHQQQGSVDELASPSSRESVPECLERACVDQASIMLNMMNTSADPCEDFFNYACGGLESQVYDVLTETQVHNVYDWVDEENENLILRLLQKLPQETPASDPALKARDFYSSCINQYENQLHSTALLVDLINDIGGLDLLGTWNETSWDKNTAIIKMHTEHWSNALWRFFWIPVGNNTHILKISPANPIMPDKSYYLDNATIFVNYENAYREMMYNVMEKIVLNNDANKTNSSGINTNSSARCHSNGHNLTQCLREFVNDVIEFETVLANNSAKYNIRDRHIPLWRKLRSSTPTRTTVSYLVEHYPQVEWMRLFESLAGASVITPQTHIQIPQGNYMQYVANLIEVTNKRKLHHFIVWHIVMGYIQTLGTAYIHEYYKYWQALNDGKTPPSREYYCRRKLREHMSPALAHVFISNHTGVAQVRQCAEFSDRVRSAFSSSLAAWLQPASSLTGARRTLQQLHLYAGYLDWVMDGEQVEKYYSSLSIDRRRFFHNIRALSQFRRYHLRDRLKSNGAEHRWSMDAWEAQVVHSKSGRSVAVTAGAMKVPIYHPALPEYINLAKLGTVIAEKLAFFTVAPDWGSSHYTAPDWWSEESNRSIFEFKQCIRSLYTNQTILVPPYFHRVEQTFYSISHLSPVVYMPYLVAIHHAFNTLYHHYAQALAENARLPGFGATSADQMFFLAYVQTRCVVRYPSKLRFILYKLSGEIPADYMINAVVYSHEKFSEAYGCSSISPRYSSKFCQLK